MFIYVLVHTHCLLREEIEEPQPTHVTVKLSGDGANIASSSTMVFLTFSFPGLAENVLSAAGRGIYTLYNPSSSYIHVYVYHL